MQIKTLAAVLIALLAMAAMLAPASAEAPREKLTLAFDTYDDTAETGIKAGRIGLVRKLAPRFYVDARLGVDAVTGATAFSNSGEDEEEAEDIQSEEDDDGGDGSEIEQRLHGRLGGVYDDGLNTFSAGVYYSHEDDYVGRSVFLSYARLLNSENTEIGLSLSQSFDTWEVSDLPEDERNEREVGLSLRQLLSDSWQVRLGYSMPYSEGYLASPRNTLEIDGVEYAEYVPDERTGHAFSVGTVKLLGERTSANLSYRYYTDDWEIDSHTVNTELFFDLTPRLTLGGRYRFYTQSAAWFMKSPGEYDSTDRYAGVDPRLSDLDSQTLGVSLIYRPRWGEGSIDWENVSLKATADYYFTSDNEYIRHLYDEDSLHAVFTTWSLEYAF